MTYSEAKNYLFGLKHHKAKYGIERMQLLADRMNHPENYYPIIHVAGTNGKGSTCALLESIYRDTGLKTGLFTSPHLVFLGERIQINREKISEEEICKYIPYLKQHAEALGNVMPEDHPSFFEFMTGMALTHFKEKYVDLAIIETGLGGRLDATNIVKPILSVITSISYDHIELLGEDIETIASEKAGIIKEGIPVIIGKLDPKAESIIRKVAKEKNSPLYSVREEYGDDIANYPRTCLKGEYQRLNAATASLATKVLNQQFPVRYENIEKSFQETEWAGRWQEFQTETGKRLILDSTHNPEGAQFLEQQLKKLHNSTGKKPIIIAGTLGNMRASSLIPIVAKYAKEIILLSPNQLRACSFEELEEALPVDFKGKTSRGKVDEIFPSHMTCEVGNAEDIIVVTGSIYLIGEVMENLLHDLQVSESILQD